jgi:hypothetical protein
MIRFVDISVTVHFPGLIPLTHKYMTVHFPGLIPLTHKYMIVHIPGSIPLTHKYILLLKYIYQARKVNGHVFMC